MSWVRSFVPKEKNSSVLGEFCGQQRGPRSLDHLPSRYGTSTPVRAATAAAAPRTKAAAASSSSGRLTRGIMTSSRGVTPVAATSTQAEKSASACAG